MESASAGKLPSFGKTGLHTSRAIMTAGMLILSAVISIYQPNYAYTLIAAIQSTTVLLIVDCSNLAFGGDKNTHHLNRVNKTYCQILGFSPIIMIAEKS